jgi:hypothetical protein
LQSPDLQELREIGWRTGEVPLQLFGWSVAGLGDVNGDEIPDFVVGAPSNDVEFHWRRENSRGECWRDVERGSAWVFSGKDFTVIHHWYGDAEGCRFGHSVAAAGDVNGDGHADILVGAPGSATVPGFVRLYSGKDGYGLMTLTSGHLNDGFGACVRAASSATSNGLIVVGAPQDEGLGSVWVFTGADFKGFRAKLGSVRDAKFGSALDLVPDGNGDGTLDVAVGAPGSDSDRTGAVFLLSGSTGEVLSQSVDPLPPSAFGTALRTMRNIDGKGTLGLAVGAPWYGEAPDYGGAVIFLALHDGKLSHSSTGPSSQLQLDEFRCREESEYGHAIATVGDMDGDAIDDLLIGAPKGFWCGGDVGWAEIGSSKSEKTIHFLNFEGDEWRPFQFGFSVDSIGDVDGDGQVDLLVGAPDTGFFGGGVQVASGATGKVITEILAESVMKQWAK